MSERTQRAVRSERVEGALVRLRALPAALAVALALGAELAAASPTSSLAGSVASELLLAARVAMALVVLPFASLPSLSTVLWSCSRGGPAVTVLLAALLAVLVVRTPLVVLGVFVVGHGQRG